ncbi:MAG: hypothetical protein KIT11_09510 [Fimbriimonadaceae bacterium]|nr:hypothetical protein [Fimbriimonadaceae bacterium]QYK55564.1 MAG: hypothetical protein KF733_11180 [Fimbriimonadaceae bacterium]
MRAKDISASADALLGQIERDRSAPHYREDSFRRKLEEAHKRESKMPLPAGGKEAHYLITQEWIEVTEAAGLTEGQLEVVRLRLAGNTFEEIGRRRGHTKQGAQNVFFQAAKKLVRAWMDYPYRGLHQVFREEVRRGYLRPRR